MPVRQRGTRPWTVVVLSDYGRDRWAFQQAELLFEPEIEALRLPTRNPYILRIQATYFLLDWLGRRLGDERHGGPFSYLRRPGAAEVQRRAAALLEELLRQAPAWQDFRRDFIRALGAPLNALGERLTEAEVDAVLWEAPRPLLRRVVPCLLRKLEAGWIHADPKRAGQIEDHSTSQPLPEYLPRATFAELDLAEVHLELDSGQGPRDEYLSVGRALFESCPGRVSKRFATRAGEAGYWHSLSATLTGGPATASVRDLYPDSMALDVADGARIVQPLKVILRHRDPKILDSSWRPWRPLAKRWERPWRRRGFPRRGPQLWPCCRACCARAVRATRIGCCWRSIASGAGAKGSWELASMPASSPTSA